MSKTLEDGSKIIFIGNSFIYYGGCVDDSLPKPSVDDRGLFYLLCKENKEDVQITNATYGRHHLFDFVDRCFCSGSPDHEPGTDLLAGLDLSSYDHIVIAESGDWFGEDALFGSTVENYRMLIERFSEAGCAGQFYYCLHTYPYTSDRFYAGKAVAQAAQIAGLGAKIINWGAPIFEAIMNSGVEGGSLEMDKNSFIVKQSERDGYHPNILTGYLTALAVHKAITGTPAEGQPFDFCGSYADLDLFLADHYGYELSKSNFTEILSSPADMLGLQKLIDKYNP